MQLHIVPSGWALATFLWHGYRQYSLGALAARFPADRTDIYQLGAAARLVLHMLCVTLPEILLRFSLRRKFGTAYARMLRAGLRLDNLLPAMPVAYAVCERNASAPIATRTAAPLESQA